MNVSPFASQKRSTGSFCACGTGAHLTLITFGRFASLALRLCVVSSPPQKRNLVGSSGLEPPTSRLSGVRSNQLSYEPIQSDPGRFPPHWKLQLVSCASFAQLEKVGGDERVRTDDPLLAKQVLSQLSYTPTVIPAFVLLPFESTVSSTLKTIQCKSLETRICFLRCSKP